MKLHGMASGFSELQKITDKKYAAEKIREVKFILMLRHGQL